MNEEMIYWIDHLEPFETPLLSNPFAPPRYARPTITERIEPYASQYDELWHEHPDYWACPDCGGHVDPEFYQPTAKLLELDARLDELRSKAFRDVPNPDYDEERAEAWREKRKPVSCQKITFGQSYDELGMESD